MKLLLLLFVVLCPLKANCSNLGPCLNTGGLVENDDPCECGSSTIKSACGDNSTGKICYENDDQDGLKVGSCRLNTFGAFGYSQLASGKCADAGNEVHIISDILECNLAATRIGNINNTIAIEETTAGTPPGCYLQISKSQSGTFTKQLRFNGRIDDNPSVCTDTQKCICLTAFCLLIHDYVRNCYF